MEAQALNGRLFDQKAFGHPKILEILASTLEKSILKNEKQLKAAHEKDVVTIFHGSRAPELSIRHYIERIFKYANCSPSCFVVAYVYMEKFLNRSNGYLTPLNVHRLLITSFMLASKFLEDECHNNAYYAKVGGITTAEINRLEMKLLDAVDFRLHVSEEMFHHFCCQLEEAAREKSRIGRPFQLCGFRKGFTNKDGSNLAPTAPGYLCRAIYLICSFLFKNLSKLWRP